MAAKHLEKMRKEELKAQRDASQQQQQQLEQQQLLGQQQQQQLLEQQQQLLEQQQQQQQQLEQPTTDLTQDKKYTKEDLSKASSELEKLKKEAERREIILKNTARNIKLLKSRRHGEDSEQRQLQQKEYDQKERELILFKKLI